MDTTSLLRETRYKRRLFFRYLGLAIIPFMFFVVIGTFSVILAQTVVSRELVELDRRNLLQARDAVEVVLGETDALALSMSTDPEFFSAAEKVLGVAVATLDDVKLLRTVISGLNSAVNTRQYLHSIYVRVRTRPARLLTTSDGIVETAGFHDAGWLPPAAGKEEIIGSWLEPRPLSILPGFERTRPVLCLYRNMLAPSSFNNNGLIALNLKIEHFESILASLKSSAGQRFAVFDSGNKLLVKSPDFKAEAIARMRLPQAAEGAVELPIEGVPYVVNVLASQKFALTYCSFTSARDVFRLADTLRDMSLLFASAALLAGFGLTWIMARRNFRNIEGIVDIIQAAEHGRNMPEPVVSGNDSFSSLTYSILKTFVEHKYLKLRQTTLELQALQSQMNPHFLFNTLTTISCRALEFTGAPNDVTGMISRLASILEYSLENPRAGVRLAEEIEFTRNYLEIQRVRYRDRFKVEWELGGGTENCRVIKLLLQPLLENAIYHGVQAGGRPGLIRVSAARENEKLHIKIEDDGAGIRPEELARIRERLRDGGAPDEHIGLFNTVKRLDLFFAGGTEVRIDGSPGRGFSVELVMPALDA